MSDKITEYNLPVNSYASFDAQSIRQLFIDKLNSSDEVSFTDQNYEGSNLNSILDVLSQITHTLLFYLNQTSSEANFSDAQLYENINRIVKLIDYKPLGRQSCVLPIEATAAAQDLSIGFYTIPRYSFVNNNGKIYSFVHDVTFEKTNTTLETLTAVGENILLYEGQFQEYPRQLAQGDKNEIINILPGKNVIIDHFNTHVYVKDINENKWYQWNSVPSLFLCGPNDKKVEIRFNQDKNYEIKFGNNINGKKLNPGDVIAVYYLRSSGSSGKATKNTFNQTPLTLYSTNTFNEIFDEIKDTTLNYLQLSQAHSLTITNTEESTNFSEEESVEEIKQNAPKLFSSEYKLLTKDDFKQYIIRNFNNVIYDVAIGNNSDYVNIFLNYVTSELGLTDYTNHNNALFNQIQYADSCDFNNVYVTAVPKIRKNNSTIIRSNYLSPALKVSIIDSLRQYKTLTSEVTFLDPVYMSVDFGAVAPGEQNLQRHKDNSILIVQKNNNVLKSNESIKSEVYNIISQYFDTYKLGQTVDLQYLNNQISNIQGIDNFYVSRTDINFTKPGITFAIWNPIYKGRDIKYIDSNYKLKFFQILYLFDKSNFKNKIQVQTITKNKTIIEY